MPRKTFDDIRAEERAAVDAYAGHKADGAQLLVAQGKCTAEGAAIFAQQLRAFGSDVAAGLHIPDAAAPLGEGSHKSREKRDDA